MCCRRSKSFRVVDRLEVPRLCSEPDHLVPNGGRGWGPRTGDTLPDVDLGGAGAGLSTHPMHPIEQAMIPCETDRSN